VHSLVPHLAWKFDAGQNAGGIDDDDAQLAVTGIFEASILTALSLLRLPAAPFSGPADQPRQWGIVTTGKFWEDHLADGVATFLGQGQCHSSTEPAAGAAETDHQVQQVGAAAAAAAEEQKTLSPPNLRFAGVQSTGLNAGDFHGPDAVPPQVVRQKMHEATARLLSNGRVDVVVMGCAGMAGLETIIREVAIETYGPDAGMRVYIVDGVKAGVVALEGMVRERRMFR
jgi:Asp/Glu/hydantoin racemase